MPADRAFAQRGAGNHVRTNNKVFLGADGSNAATYEATLVFAEYFYADARGRFVKNQSEATQQRVKLCWSIDGSDYVLRDDFPVKFHEKSLYAARAREVAGARTPAEIDTLDFEKTIGAKCYIDIESTEKKPADKPSYWWTDVREVRSRERRVSRPPGAAAQPGAARRTEEPAAPQPAAAPVQQAQPLGTSSLDEQLSLISLPSRRSIEALAKFKNISDQRLRVLIGSIAGAHEPLPVDAVEQLKESMRVVAA